MGEKDLTEKILEDYNEVFADIINVLLFNGEQRVNPNSLKNSSVHSQYKADDGKIHEQERDVAKTWTECDVELALYGLENQTKIEKLMPLRIFGYEGASYRSQFQRKLTKPVPVITMVLYFGEDHWTSKTSLKEIMDIPKGLDNFVNDCKINVFEISWLTDKQIQMFKSDFKVVANFFINKRKNRNYIPDDRTSIAHIDEVLKLLKAMTGDDRYEKLLEDSEWRASNMCEVAERLEKIGIEKGVAEGETKLGLLVAKLLSDGRTSDIELAATNKNIREKLYKEYNITD